MAKQVKVASKPTIENPVVETELTIVNEPVIETEQEEAIEPAVKTEDSKIFIAENIDDISNSVKERITQIEEMLKRKWSGWRVQKFKRELEDLKSQL